MKVNVRTVRAGVAGASGLIVLGGASGCAASASEEPAEALDAVGVQSAALASEDATNAGSAKLEFGYFYTSDGRNYALSLRESTTDEFIRVGEKLTFTFPAYTLWSILYPSAPELPTLEQLQKLQATITVSFDDVRTGKTETTTVTASKWSGTYYYDAILEADPVTVAKRTDTLRIAIEVVDLSEGGASTTIPAEQVQPLTVFGGDLPNKTALFDNDSSTLRTRIVEGGNLVPGSNALIAFTDWRADTVVDASKIDRQIGTVQSYGRFGPYVMPIYGEIAYEITAGYAFDDGAFQPEVALALNAASALVPAYRKDYEARIALPSSARKLKAYFHVKAYLVVDYSRWPGATRWYDEGRQLKAEKWDNPNGAFTNYELTISK